MFVAIYFKALTERLVHLFLQLRTWTRAGFAEGRYGLPTWQVHVWSPFSLAKLLRLSSQQHAYLVRAEFYCGFGHDFQHIQTIPYNIRIPPRDMRSDLPANKLLIPPAFQSALVASISGLDAFLAACTGVPCLTA